MEGLDMPTIQFSWQIYQTWLYTWDHVCINYLSAFVHVGIVAVS
jgi:hypothetical protein